MIEQVRTTRFSRADAIRLASSLVIALLLWGWVTTSRDPEINKTFVDVPVLASNLDADFQVVGDPSTVSVQIQGPRSIVNRVEQGDIRASVDLADVDDPGSVTVPIRVSSTEDIWSIRAIPDNLVLLIDETMTKQFALQVDRESINPTAGRVVDISTAVDVVTVRGPTTLVESISSVVLPLDGLNLDSTRIQQLAPVAMSEDGVPITTVELFPSTIATTITVSTTGKSVAVIMQLVGDPAPGYEVVDRTINPSTIVVEGPDEAIADLLSLSTEPVDITGAKATLSRRVRLTDLPEGVRVIEPLDGTIVVVVQIREKGVQQPLFGRVVEVMNVGEGLTAEVTPQEVNISVLGSEETLADLTGSDVHVTVDAAGLEPGTHELSPRVVLPPNVQWLTVDPQLVTVTIREESIQATPSPGIASPTP